MNRNKKEKIRYPNKSEKEGIPICEDWGLRRVDLGIS
jgi:hypothetical protein